MLKKAESLTLTLTFFAEVSTMALGWNLCKDLTIECGYACRTPWQRCCRLEQKGLAKCVWASGKYWMRD